MHGLLENIIIEGKNPQSWKEFLLVSVRKMNRYGIQGENIYDLYFKKETGKGALRRARVCPAGNDAGFRETRLAI